MRVITSENLIIEVGKSKVISIDRDRCNTRKFNRNRPTVEIL